MSRINPIPNWVYTGSLPAFYDVESGTAIEQTARLHGAVKSLIDDWNKYANELKTTLESFEKEIEDNQECFKNGMTTLIHNYIHQIDDKIANQDLVIDNAVNYMTENLGNAITELIANGNIVVGTQYNEESESLDLVAGEGGTE